jgi:hypothetical protein
VLTMNVKERNIIDGQLVVNTAVSTNMIWLTCGLILEKARPVQ